MKIIVRLMFLVLVPIIVGIALVVSGYKAGLYVLVIGTPGVMIALVITGLIMMMKGKLFPKPQDNDAESSGSGEAAPAKPPQKEQECAALNDINRSHYYTSQIKLAEYEADNIIEATKHASKKGMIAVITVAVAMVIDVILAVVLVINHIWAGAIVCVSIFGGTIIIGLITLFVKDKIALNGDISKAEKIVEGKVKSCFMISVTKTKSVTPTVRVQGVVYRVIIEADGAEYATSSTEFYETDEAVTIAVMNKKNSKIVDKETLEKLNAAKSGNAESRNTQNYYIHRRNHHRRH